MDALNIGQKDDKEVENSIRAFLKCSLCFSKVVQPKICIICHTAFCQSCINKWLQKKPLCPNCKSKASSDDMISLPILNDFSLYFINNIDNQVKDGKSNNSEENIDELSEGETEIINQENEIKTCPKHNKKIDYCCVHCNKYLCSNCLVYFEKEAKIHKDHYIIQESKIKDLGLEEAILEYSKLSLNRNLLDKLITMCDNQIQENNIRKDETIKTLNRANESFIKKIDKDSTTIEKYQNDLDTEKEKLYNSLNNISNGIVNMINSNNNNDYSQIEFLKEELQNLNNIKIENQNVGAENINLRLNMESYETEYLEFDLPFSGQIKDGSVILNTNIGIIDGSHDNFIIKYDNQKVKMTFSIDIDIPFNDISYPSFHINIIFKGSKSLAYREFPFPKNEKKKLIYNENMSVSEFLSLFGESKKIVFKFYIIKTCYTE